ncbi:MAG: ArsR family transcriptional regulator [Phycisphaerales bacterium]|nr:ArsR family transcriptional regulator [Phycisphaerales bacterium]
MTRADALREAQDRFVAAWGQMAAAWGISRTMAEVYALLHITGEPMCTDDVMARLQISRGNASMSLRSLQDWGIVTLVTRRGGPKDYKKYFTAEQDVWALFRAIVRERMKREVEPLLASLYEIRDLTGIERDRSMTAEERRALVGHNQRLDAMLDFFKTLDKLGQRFISPSGRGLRLAASMLAKVS